MKLSFLGGAKSVTGANYLLEVNGKNILIDCGLFQGDKKAEEENFSPFSYDPKTIDAVFITHGHADHVGKVPFLYHHGFKGNVYATAPTRDIALIVLRDSIHILASEHPQKQKECEELAKITEGLGKFFHVLEYEQDIDLGEGITAKLKDAGHILGSSFVEIEANGKLILFSGDIGNTTSEFFDDPTRITKADYVIMESVYGDRIRPEDAKRKDMLEDVIEDTVKRNGVVLIPAFAVERTQEVLYDLDSLVTQGRIPEIPVFVDSPMAIAATKVFQSYPEFYRKEIQKAIQGGEDLFNFKGLVFSESTEESKSINEVTGPKIIIAGSGMSTGGRILHHEARYLSDPDSTILFVGYQAKRTRGRSIRDGAKQVKIFGKHVPIRCNIRVIDGYSAHADQEQLVNWVKPFKSSVKQVFLVQGEAEASQALAYRLKDFLGIDARIPSPGDSIEL